MTIPKQLEWAQSLRAKGRLAMNSGKSSEVESLMGVAIELFRQLPAPFWMAVTLLEQGEWLIKQDREDEAVPMVDEAHGIFAALRAGPWLQRVAQLPLGSHMTA